MDLGRRGLSVYGPLSKLWAVFQLVHLCPIYNSLLMDGVTVLSCCANCDYTSLVSYIVHHLIPHNAP